MTTMIMMITIMIIMIAFKTLIVTRMSASGRPRKEEFCFEVKTSKRFPRILNKEFIKRGEKGSEGGGRESAENEKV